MGLLPEAVKGSFLKYEMKDEHCRHAVPLFGTKNTQMKNANSAQNTVVLTMSRCSRPSELSEKMNAQTVTTLSCMKVMAFIHEAATNVTCRNTNPLTSVK